MHTTSTTGTTPVPSAAATAVTAPRGAAQGGMQGIGQGGPPGGGDMVLHNLVLFAHVVGVVGLFMALGIELFAVLRLRRTTSIAQIGEWSLATRVTHLVHLVSTPLIVASGLYMVVAEFGWTTAWIDVSLVVMLLLSSSGMFVSWQRIAIVGREAARLSDSFITTAFARRMHDPVLYAVTHVQVGVALGILYLMLLKPDLTWSLFTIILAALLGLVASWLTRHSAVAPPPRRRAA